MALQGSLDDVALVDVLALLSSTRKTGELRVDGSPAAGGRGRGRLWLVDGLVVASEPGVTDRGDAVDVLFELLRLERGTFLFSAGVHAARPGPAREVAPIVDEARARLEEWRAIEAVVPSLATRVSLVPEIPGPTVVLDAANWPVLVAVAEGGTVAAAAEALGTGEFGACRAVKALVDAGLVRVAAARDRRAVDDPEREDAVAPADADPVPVEAPATERFAAALRAVEGVAGPRSGRDAARTVAGELLTAEEVAAAGAAGLIDEHGDPINRSLLLKFLSSVRS